MTSTIPSTDLVVSLEPLFTDTERIALAGFLVGYGGLTRDAYSLDLRVFTAWCQLHGLRLFRPVARTSSASAATWRPAGEPAQRSRGGYA